MNINDFFSYSISRHQSLVVVTLSGKFDHNALNVFAQFEQELLQESAPKSLLMDLSHLQAVTVDAFSSFVLFQKNLRNQGVTLKLCSLDEKLRDKLTTQGVIRHSEISISLKAALESIIETRPSKAS